MTSHRTIMIRAALAVKESAAVLNYCKQHFGRGLEIVVGAYPSGIPTVENSPFLWIFAAPDENAKVAADETFTLSAVVGGAVVGADGEKVLSDVVDVRTENVNGLIVNGGNAVVEDLRDMIMNILADAKAGAIVRTMRKTENDLSHFPLEWAEFEVDYWQPEAL